MTEETIEAPDAKSDRAAKAAKTRARGKAFELKIRHYLASLGFATQPAHQQSVWTPKGRISTQADFWGALDMLAFHPALPYVLGVQATLNESMVRAKMRDCEAARVKVNGEEQSIAWCPAMRIQVWTKDRSTQNRFIVWQKGSEGWAETSFRMEDGVWPPAGILGERPEA